LAKGGCTGTVVSHFRQSDWEGGQALEHVAGGGRSQEAAAKAKRQVKISLFMAILKKLD